MERVVRAIEAALMRWEECLVLTPDQLKGTD